MIKPSAPVIAPDERMAHLVRYGAREFTRALQSRLGLHGVTFGQWIFLRILWQEDALSQRELSIRANLTEPTTHAALERLEALGHVTRRNLNGNKRRRHVFLTQSGLAMRDLLEPLAIEVNDAALAGFDEDEVASLRSMMLRVLENLARDEAEGLEQGRRMPSTRAQSSRAR